MFTRKGESTLAPPVGQLTEPVFSSWLIGAINPDRRPVVARLIAMALLSDSSDAVRTRAATEPLWGWSCSGAPASDGLLGDGDDRAIATFEFKGPGTPVNWPRRSTARRVWAKDDPTALEVAGRTFLGTEVALDRPHFDAECEATEAACKSWRMAGGGRHAPCVHQGDVYSTSSRYLPAGLALQDLGSMSHVFVAPNEPSRTAWFVGLESGSLWDAVLLPDLLEQWRRHRHVAPDMERVVGVTERFLNA